MLNEVKNLAEILASTPCYPPIMEEFKKALGDTPKPPAGEKSPVPLFIFREERHLASVILNAVKNLVVVLLLRITSCEIISPLYPPVLGEFRDRGHP